MTDPNRERLRRAVAALEGVGTESVFLGGATVGLHLRPELQEYARQTKDVDCVVPVDAQFQWHELEAQLRAASFTNDTKTVVRYRYEGDVFDFIPYGETMSGLLGFDVRFHREAFESAVELEIAPGCRARVVSLPYLFVTKVCAFEDRGRADPYESKDLEDLVVLLMGSDVRSQLEGAPSAVTETVTHWC